MKTRSLACLLAWVLALVPGAAFADVIPCPPYPGAVPSVAYKVTVNGQPVFVHNYLTFDQFNWMDYASFSMTGTVHVEITSMVSDRTVLACNIRPLAYDIKPKIEGNKIAFDLDRPRYLVIFINDEPAFNNTGLLLFAEAPEQNPPRLGDANVVNIKDYNVDDTGKTLETAKINQAISDVSAKPGGGVLFFPPGVYQSGTVVMKSNIKFYVDAGAVIRGSRKSADYGGTGRRCFFSFNNVENASLAGRGTIDMQGYPWLWHDFQPDTSDSNARDAAGKVKDPRNGIRGYIINNSRNVTFQDLLLTRGCYWQVNVTGTENFTSRNIKIVSRKQQYHDDAYDFTNARHTLIENGFAMTMDDTFAFYGGGNGAGVDDLVVKGFLDYSYTAAVAIGYGSAPPIKHLRLEDVHFVSTHNKPAIWVQLSPAYFTGRGYASGSRSSKRSVLDDFHFVNCTFENDGGAIYIDGGNNALTNFAFENCTFYKPSKPGLIIGKQVAPILFKNVKMNGAAISNIEQLKATGFDITVPARFEP